MTQFFNKFKKPCFWLFQLLGQTLSRTTSYEFLALCQNLEKTND